MKNRWPMKEALQAWHLKLTLGPRSQLSCDANYDRRAFLIERNSPLVGLLRSVIVAEKVPFVVGFENCRCGRAGISCPPDTALAERLSPHTLRSASKTRESNDIFVTQRSKPHTSNSNAVSSQPLRFRIRLLSTSLRRGRSLRCLTTAR